MLTIIIIFIIFAIIQIACYRYSDEDIERKRKLLIDDMFNDRFGDD